MRQGLDRTLAKRMRGENHFSRSDKRSRSTRFGLEIFSMEYLTMTKVIKWQFSATRLEPPPYASRF